MEELVLKLISQKDEEFTGALDTFLNNYSNKVSVTRFEFLDKKNLRSQIWEAILSHLKNEEYNSLHAKCLAALRILSRDKTDLDTILSKEKLDIILKCAGLDVPKKQYIENTVTIEGQKLLCNIIFNSLKIQKIIPETACLKCLIDRISKYNDSTYHLTKLFDTRIIFLITALNDTTRSVVNNELQGDLVLIKMLENISKHLSLDNKHCKLEDNSAILACEILKALYNLFLKPKDLKIEAVEELEAFENLVIILRKLFLSENEVHKKNLESDVVNLLTVIPTSFYSKLILLISDDHQDIIVYQNTDMTVVNELLNFLENRLESKTNLFVNLSPIFTCLIRMCKTEKLIRKYVRLQVLPPLRDMNRRPEEGFTLRNKLCLLLTNPTTEIRDLDAEFLFILCKENVGRMIKYTGYGNAAGMFANKGLLGPDNARIDYSSDSEDSETEEYKKNKDRINPVTGCYDKEKTNPFEGMTEEQKEYEAMKLVGFIDQLQREGIIQPCRVGEDGKPKPVEHVLELEEHLSKQQIHKRGSDSD